MSERYYEDFRVGERFISVMAGPNHSRGKQRLAEMPRDDLLRLAYRCQVHARVPAQQEVEINPKLVEQVRRKRGIRAEGTQQLR